MVRKTRKELKSGLHVLLWQEGGWFVARCLEVEIASQGKNRSEAIKNIEEALELYFENEKVPLPQPLMSVEVYPVNPKVITYA